MQIEAWRHSKNSREQKMITKELGELSRLEYSAINDATKCTLNLLMEFLVH